MTTSTETVRPDTTFIAPDVRVVKLGKLGDKGEAGKDLTAERPYITSVEVTRVNSGVSQYSIVLNNWNDVLPAHPGGEARREWPPYQYNDFKLFKFGQRLRIDMRYSPKTAEESVEPAQPAHRWVPMIAGPITDMRFSFSSGEGATLTLIGEDDLYPLRNKISEDRPPESTERGLVKTLLAWAGYPLPLQQPHVSWPGFFTDRASRRSVQLNEGQSYLEALEDLAKRFDCEIHVDFETLASQAPKVQFFFEPSRSRLPPDGNTGDLYLLERGRNLIEFTPTFKVFEQYTGVTVRGRHRARGRARPVRTAADASKIYDELHQPPADPNALTSGPKVRMEYFGRTFGENNHQLSGQSNLDDERAAAMAEAVFRQKAREFMTVTGATVGMPHLRPGVHVEIRGMRPPFDGYYYVERTVSRFGSSGFTTQFTARRPGMPLPPYSQSQEE
jgi:hypothetical protein